MWDLKPSFPCFKKSAVATSMSLSDGAEIDSFTAEHTTLHNMVSRKARFPLRPEKLKAIVTSGSNRRRRIRRVASRLLSPPTRPSCFT